MPQGHAELRLAFEELDLGRVTGPAAAEHLDGDDGARARIIGAKHPAEAAGGNPIEEPIVAQEITVLLPLEELLRLERGEVTLALQRTEYRMRVGGEPPIIVALLDLRWTRQSKIDRELRQRGSVGTCHSSLVRAGDPQRQRIAPFYRTTRLCQEIGFQVRVYVGGRDR